MFKRYLDKDVAECKSKREMNIPKRISKSQVEEKLSNFMTRKKKKTQLQQ